MVLIGIARNLRNRLNSGSCWSIITIIIVIIIIVFVMIIIMMLYWVYRENTRIKWSVIFFLHFLIFIFWRHILCFSIKI